jgi:hypothetical protein
MEVLIVVAVAVGVWFFFFRNKEEKSAVAEEAAPYKVEAPAETTTVAHNVAGLTVLDTVPVAPAEAAPAPVAEEAKPKKKPSAKKPATPRKKKAV